MSEPDFHPSARADFVGALVWICLGLAVLAGALTMDRLEAQHVPFYTVPGLLPGLLGVLMTALGALLAFRSWRHRPPDRPAPASPAGAFQRRARHLVLVIALCLGFGIGLVGHGLPFWMAAALFVTAAIPALQYPERRAAGRRLNGRDLFKAAAIGLGAGGAITVIFQKIFLVHLP